MPMLRQPLLYQRTKTGATNGIGAEGSRAHKGGSSFGFQDRWCEVTGSYGILYKKHKRQAETGAGRPVFPTSIGKGADGNTG